MVAPRNLSSASYAPAQLPADPKDLPRFVREETDKISAAIALLAAGHLDKQYAAPIRPRDGDIRYAAGAPNWNPGSGIGPYYFDGTTWQALAPRRVWAKFHWDGTNVVIDGSSGVLSITRTAAGDYLVTFTTAFPTANYCLSVTLDTNASGHGGTFSVGSHTSSNARLYTYAQNGATSTLIDPRFVWFSASQ